MIKCIEIIHTLIGVKAIFAFVIFLEKVSCFEPNALLIFLCLSLFGYIFLLLLYLQK